MHYLRMFPHQRKILQQEQFEVKHIHHFVLQMVLDKCIPLEHKLHILDILLKLNKIVLPLLSQLQNILILVLQNQKDKHKFHLNKSSHPYNALAQLDMVDQEVL